ncbi:MAG: hypothetical protein AVDCRST_MAG39-1318 [uncultured Sphingomonadaceae bacterium]|uniref:Methylated-DNA-[protein]-cysteine S-methyltransferase DNA binding domain-containing protein n=1 Tax=uncultured Sphingomonadaceae bacterium TaxID=169976 RepID=A0A6J4SIW4_9SPHN|nr:MAG: hypothetical protein AVDCRST_MAG39-1318 [uncultured Sphingomonadaceae bacterium]
MLVPCYRARRGDGSPGGYASGLERKEALLAREADGYRRVGIVAPREQSPGTLIAPGETGRT